MAVCLTDVPAREETASQGPQYFYVIIQSKPASSFMHRKDCAEIAATTILLLFQKSENLQRVIFLTGSLCLGLCLGTSPSTQAALQHCSPAPCCNRKREIKVNRILPPRGPVLSGKSYSLQKRCEPQAERSTEKYLIG